jgi:hypothetical protein
MTKKMALGRLREISKQRSIRPYALHDRASDAIHAPDPLPIEAAPPVRT